MQSTLNQDFQSILKKMYGVIILKNNGNIYKKPVIQKLDKCESDLQAKSSTSNLNIFYTQVYNYIEFILSSFCASLIHSIQLQH